MLKLYCVHFKVTPLDVDSEPWQHFWTHAMDETDAVDQCANVVYPEQIYLFKVEDVTES